MLKSLNLAEIIEDLNTIIRSQVKAKDQEFEIYTTSFTYEHLVGDKMRINQILINILSNAVKYTPKGGRIEMSICELPPIMENYSRVQFNVKDNGQGMSEDYQKVMFDPFTREQNTMTNKIQGTGLGMAITKNLVEPHGRNPECGEPVRGRYYIQCGAWSFGFRRRRMIRSSGPDTV